MKYIKRFESNIDDYEEYFSVLRSRHDSIKDRVEKLKELIGRNVDINSKNDYNWTPILLIADMIGTPSDDMKTLLELVIDSGADWSQKLIGPYDLTLYKPDFIDLLKKRGKNKLVDEIIKKYPEKYQEYLMKKNAEKYNL